MPRQARYAPGGSVYHVLNRAVARLPLLEKDGDYEAFERVLAQAQERAPTRLLAYCLMPNHWHLVLWPRRDDELTTWEEEKGSGVVSQTAHKNKTIGLTDEGKVKAEELSWRLFGKPN